MRKCCSALGWIPVVLVWGIVLWSFYVYVYLLVGKTYVAQGQIAAGVIQLLVYFVIYGIFVVSYYKVIFTDPGRAIRLAGSRGDPEAENGEVAAIAVEDKLGNGTERSFMGALDAGGSGHSTPVMGEAKSDDILLSMPDVDLNEPTVSYVAQEVKHDGKPRYCKKCAVHKPDRTHHCSICDRCVLKMDHHCPWINNCIGYSNYKYFYLFVTWGTVYCLYVCGTTIPAVMDLFQPGQNGLGADQLQKALLVLISGIFSLALAMFTAMHTSLLLSNKSTIESFTDKTLIRLDGIGPMLSVESTHIYDLGWRENFRQVMGHDPWLQWLPVDASVGNGHSFPMGKSAYEKCQAAMAAV